jgi:hypothetical protein
MFAKLARIRSLFGRRNQPRQGYPGRKLCLEVLENRIAPATFINPAGGDWFVATNWSGGQIPMAGDDVTIPALAGPVIYRFSFGSGLPKTINSLLLDGTLELHNALDVATSVDGSGMVTLNGGTLGRATVAKNITISGSGPAPGILDGITLNGHLVVRDSIGVGVVVTSYTQTAKGTLEVQIGNSSAITPFPRIQVTPGGVVRLAGTLTATYVNSFIPSTGQRFWVIGPGGVGVSVTGTFNPVVGGAAVYQGPNVFLDFTAPPPPSPPPPVPPPGYSPAQIKKAYGIDKVPLGKNNMPLVALHDGSYDSYYARG